MYRINGLLGVLTLLLFTACNGDKKDSSTFFGNTDYYEDFLFYKYEPTQMTKMLRLEFNEDASQSNNISFGLYEKTENGTFIPAKENVILYKNGQVCSNNTFTVSGNEDSMEVGLEFTPQARPGTHKWYLKLLSARGLDRVNEFEMSDDPYPVVLEWRAKKTEVWNPLKLILFWTVIILVALFLLWMLVLRSMLFPRFKVGAVTVTDPYYSMRRLKGSYKLICTPKPMKQSFLSSFFIGKIVYEVNPFWTTAWTILPRDRSSIKPVSNRNYTFEPYTVTLKKGMEYKVTNQSTNEKITLTVN